MTLSKEEKDQLIRYRLDQSHECVEEVAFLVQNEKFKTAINRIYYGLFYTLLALGLKYGFETSKHLQLIGWFNNTFIRTGKLNKEFGKIVNRSYSLRQESDNEPFITYEKQQVTGLYEKMREFIGEVEKIIFEYE
jgi:uncharacterized protein